MSYLCYMCLFVVCVVFLCCFSSSCIPYVASFSGLSIFDCPFGMSLTFIYVLLNHFSMLSSLSQCLCVCYNNCFDKRIQIISYRLPSLYSWHNLLLSCLHWNTSYLRNVQVKQKKTVKTLKNQICYKYLSEKIVLLFIDICQYYQVGDTS